MPKKIINKFEKNLNDLEKIVDKMESETLSLEDSLKQFEQGIKLVKACQKELTEAEQKIKQLIGGKLKSFEMEA